MAPPRAAHDTVCLCSDRLQASATGSQCATRTGEIRARQYMRTTHWLPSATSADRDGTHRGLGADSQQTLADSFRLHVKPKIRQREEFYDASSTMARPYQQDRA
jgi:hypothetical protein